MRLKEIAGERDMFDVLKKQEKKMKKDAEKRVKDYNKPAKSNVFDFINKKLGGKKGKISCTGFYLINSLNHSGYFHVLYLSI